MLNDAELLVILKSFYRSSDGVLIRVIDKKLEKYRFNRKGIIYDAIDDGILKQITPYRVILTKISRKMWRDARKERLV